MQRLVTCEINKDEDIVWVRNKARQITEFLGMSREDQTRVSTAVSEIARNAFQYATGGRAFFNLVEEQSVFLEIQIVDRGPGIGRMREIEAGDYKSQKGMGIGLMGARRLMDSFEIETGEGGTRIRMRKALGRFRELLSTKQLNALLQTLSQPTEHGSLVDLKRQNEDIINALTELNDRREELLRLNKELEETNKGVVALYAELDEKAHSLRLASESKTAFLSNLTHEFRSPLNAILNLSRILLVDAQRDGANERQKQVTFIQEAAQSLSDLVNDLLDIAKIEAGKIQVRVSRFTTHDLMSTLRGLMRPLAQTAELELLFHDGEDITLFTDEAKLAQILRNLVSNALKYTEQGSVEVSIGCPSPGRILFTVKDTGIGIPEDKQEAIFDEFVQVENARQEKVKGTGLGLPLSRRLARILGGDLWVESMVGKGSTFYALVDRDYQGEALKTTVPPTGEQRRGERMLSGRTLLLVDDQELERQVMAESFSQLGALVLGAAGVDEAIRLARNTRPDLIVLDLIMPDKTGLDFINERLDHPGLREVPVVLHTSKHLEAEERDFLEQSVACIVSKDEGFEPLLAAVAAALPEGGTQGEGA